MCVRTHTHTVSNSFDVVFMRSLALLCLVSMRHVWFFTKSYFSSGVPVKAILQMGPHLQRWSRELESGIVSNGMFGLVPGEDELFANTILLRLADAFRGGNTEIRLSVVRVFLIERKHHDNRKHKQCKGLLSVARVANHLELLKRVKSVFNSGDSESKALALVLFGCWADFANDNAQIRYLILSTLVSPHDSEVRLVSCSVAVVLDV